MIFRLAIALLILTVPVGFVLMGSAQGPRNVEPVPVTTIADELPPISPKEKPGPMSLDACIELGMQHQPALHAAQASLASAQTGQQALNRLIIPRLFKRDLPVRRDQSCQGVTIAGAALTQAEWETRYAVTRNFFTVQYVRSQQKVIADVLQTLTNGYEKAKKIYDAGDPKTKITSIDLDSIKINIELVKAKREQADAGILKAEAALREAMGLGYDYPLNIAVVDLPPAVYEVKTERFVDVKDDKGKIEKKKEIVTTFHPLYKFNKADLVNAAVTNRPEMSQANAASIVLQLEIDAQAMSRGYQVPTFAMGSDPHVQQIPQGEANGNYRPGAFSIEAPPTLAGRKGDRVQRARDLHQRALAVVEKAHNLVSLDVEVQYLKWHEAAEQVKYLRGVYDKAQQLPDLVLKTVGANDLTSTPIIQANLMAINVRTTLNDEMHLHALALAGLERATAGTFRVFPVPAPPQK